VHLKTRRTAATTPVTRQRRWRRPAEPLPRCPSRWFHRRQRRYRQRHRFRHARQSRTAGRGSAADNARNIKGAHNQRTRHALPRRADDIRRTGVPRSLHRSWRPQARSRENRIFSTAGCCHVTAWLAWLCVPTACYLATRLPCFADNSTATAYRHQIAGTYSYQLAVDTTHTAKTIPPFWWDCRKPSGLRDGAPCRRWGPLTPLATALWEAGASEGGRETFNDNGATAKHCAACRHATGAPRLSYSRASHYHSCLMSISSAPLWQACLQQEGEDGRQAGVAFSPRLGMVLSRVA